MNSNAYWIKKEIEYEERWKKHFDHLPIKWISREEFWNIFNNNYKPRGIYFGKGIYFPMTLVELRERIKVPPVFTPFEEDFPGPVERWYGEINDHLFTLTYYYHQSLNLTEVSTETNPKVSDLILSTLKELKSINPFS